MKLIFLVTFLIFICLTCGGCNIAGYKTKPERLTLGFPIWFGGPSMTWTFEEDESD